MSVSARPRPLLLAVLLCIGTVPLCIGIAGGALGQPAAPAPANAVAADPLDQLRTTLGGAVDASRALRANPALPDGLRSPVDGLTEQLARARDLAGQAGNAERDAAIDKLVWLTVGFFVAAAIALVVLAWRVQKAFWLLAAHEPDLSWRNYLMQLPLGAPEGSVRAIISFYVIVFGLLVLILQDQLGLRNVEVIAGFIGIVITFYFTSRTTDQASKAVNSAVDAVNKASSQVGAVAATSQKQVDQAVGAANQAAQHAQGAAVAAQQVAAQQVAAQQVAGPPGGIAGAPDPAVTQAQSGLQTVKDGLQTATQVIGALGSLGVGTGIVSDATALTRTASGLLDAIDPLLSGRPDPAKIGDVMEKANAALGQLDNAGLPGVLGDAIAGISGIGGALGALAPIVSGISGGPAGIVFGVVMSGIQLLQQKEKFDAWKAALLRIPFSRALMPATVDGTAALAALDPAIAPLMAARIGTDNPALATGLMREMLRTDAAGNPEPAATLATELFAPGQPLGLHDRFGSERELAEAIDQYRSGLVFVNARSQLQGSVNIPAMGDQPARSIDMGGLLDSAVKLGADPRAGADIEKLVYAVEALGKLGLTPDKLTDLARSAFAEGMNLSQLDRQQADQRQ